MKIHNFGPLAFRKPIEDPDNLKNETRGLSRLFAPGPQTVVDKAINQILTEAVEHNELQVVDQSDCCICHPNIIDAGDFEICEKSEPLSPN